MSVFEKEKKHTVCWSSPLSPFPTMFPTLPKTTSIIWVASTIICLLQIAIKKEKSKNVIHLRAMDYGCLLFDLKFWREACNKAIRYLILKKLQWF